LLQNKKGRTIVLILPFYIEREFDFYFIFLLSPDNPAKPRPSNNMIVGSGTGDVFKELKE
jgi:hypothetical protein